MNHSLKPIDTKQQLMIIAKKIPQQQKNNSSSQTLLKKNINRISLPTQYGYVYKDLKEILYCEADRNYTKFFFTNGEVLLISKTLKLYSELLTHNNFFRISRSHLVNLTFIEKLIRQKKPILQMQNGAQLFISQNKREAFIQYVSNLF